MSLNGGFLDQDSRALRRHDADADTERKRPARSCRVARWKSADDWAVEVRGEAADHVERRRLTAGFVARTHFAEDDRAGAREDAGEAELREHPIEAIRTLIHVFE